MRLNKTIKIIIYIVLAVAGIYCISKGLEAFFGLKNKIKSLEKAYIISKDSSKIWFDKYNIEHRQVEQLRLDKQSLGILYAKELDSLSGLLKIKPKAIQNVIKVPVYTSINLDSLCKGDTLHIYTDTGKIKVPQYLNLSTNLTLTGYYKRSGFLGLRKDYFLDVHADNRAIHVGNIEQYGVQPKIKHWSIGPYAGYDLITRQASFGIALQYSLIRF